MLAPRCPKRRPPRPSTHKGHVNEDLLTFCRPDVQRAPNVSSDETTEAATIGGAMLLIQVLLCRRARVSQPVTYYLAVPGARQRELWVCLTALLTSFGRQPCLSEFHERNPILRQTFSLHIAPTSENCSFGFLAQANRTRRRRLPASRPQPLQGEQLRSERLRSARMTLLASDSAWLFLQVCKG
jgi:hypothetical protein